MPCGGTSYNSLYKIGISALRMNHFPAGDKISGTGLLTADSESYTLTNHTNGQKIYNILILLNKQFAKSFYR